MLDEDVAGGHEARVGRDDCRLGRLLRGEQGAEQKQDHDGAPWHGQLQHTFAKGRRMWATCFAYDKSRHSLRQRLCSYPC